MSEVETIDGSAEEIGAEVVPAPATPPTSLFRTDDPVEVLQRATDTANALAPVLQGQQMLSDIKGKKHVKIEGWTTLGSMLGVTPVGVWTKKTENGWEAKVNAQTLDGRVIGSAEAMCDREESRWASADEYAIRSMAQTRAASKALASVLRFVVTLAGFSGTPAEEMDGVRSQGNGFASEKQRYLLERLLKDDGLGEGEIAGICDFLNSTTSRKGVSNTIGYLQDEAQKASCLKWLREKADEFANELATEAEGGSFETGDDPETPIK